MTTALYGDLAHRTCDLFDEREESDLRALTNGGRELYQSGALRRLIPKHGAETNAAYERRLRDATWAGDIGAAVATQAGLVFAGAPIVATSEPAADPYLARFAESLTPLLRSVLWEGLVARRAGVLLALPDVPGPFADFGEQEAAGALEVTARLLEPRELVDVERKGLDVVRVVLHRRVPLGRPSIKRARSADVRHVFTCYAPDEWARYELVGPERPAARTKVPLVAHGRHAFGSPPVVLMDLGASLVDVLTSTAAQILRTENALDDAMHRANYPLLAAFLSAPTHDGDVIADDPQRATRNAYGTGRLVRLTSKDRLEYHAPDSGIWDASMARVEASRLALRRVAHMPGADIAMRPSDGPGGAADGDAARALARERGRALCAMAAQILALATRGRGDSPVTWRVEGLDKHEHSSRDRAIEAERNFQKLNLAAWSPTASTIHAGATARVLLGEDAPAHMARVRGELAAGFDAKRPAPTTAKRSQSRAKR